jgi:hypothetical protein
MRDILRLVVTDSFEDIQSDEREHYWAVIARVKRLMEAQSNHPVTGAAAVAKARELGISSPPPSETPQKSPRPSFAGEVLTPESQEVVRMCWSLAAADPTLRDRAIADRVTAVMIEPFPPEYRLTRDQMRAGIERLRTQQLANLLAEEAQSPSDERRARIEELRRQQLADWPVEETLPINSAPPRLTDDAGETAKETLARQIRGLVEKHKDGKEEWSRRSRRVSQTDP